MIAYIRNAIGERNIPHTFQPAKEPPTTNIRSATKTETISVITIYGMCL